MSQAMEDFIENYLLTHGYPLTDSNRERARNVLANHPDLAGLSTQDRTALLDRMMRIGFR